MELLMMTVFLVSVSVILRLLSGIKIIFCYLILWVWSGNYIFQSILGGGMKSGWILMDSLSGLMSFLVSVVILMSFLCSDKDFSFMKNSGGFSLSLTMVSLMCFCFFFSGGLMMFYFFFEASLIPTLFLILGWGYQPERLQAGFYMMMYTVSASMPLFIILCWIWKNVSSDVMFEVKMHFVGDLNGLIWFILVLGFLVKLPVFIVHGWLPKAHVEAPVSGSMVLAGILLKLGGYGFYRFLNVLSFFGGVHSHVVFISSLWGGLLCSVMCLCQSDVKALIAYSSIGHMSLVLGGILSFYSMGWMSGVSLMFAHGLCSPGLFSLANFTYGLYGSRSMMVCKGILKVFPSLAFLWFLLSVLNMGCPPSINFLSEVFLVSSIIFSNSFYFFPVGAMCFITAAYCLFLYCNMSHGSSSFLGPSFSFLSERSFFSVFFCGFILFVLCLCLDFSFVL